VLVLNAVFLILAANVTPKVGDILSHRKIASQATIHAALKKLHHKKFISFWSTKDSRAKYIELTKLGLKRFELLANAAHNGARKN
jgi:DNA-binding PadR family transcriptional regulator